MSALAVAGKPWLKDRFTWRPSSHKYRRRSKELEGYLACSQRSVWGVHDTGSFESMTFEDVWRMLKLKVPAGQKALAGKHFYERLGPRLKFFQRCEKLGLVMQTIQYDKTKKDMFL